MRQHRYHHLLLTPAWTSLLLQWAGFLEDENGVGGGYLKIGVSPSCPISVPHHQHTSHATGYPAPTSLPSTRSPQPPRSPTRR